MIYDGKLGTTETPLSGYQPSQAVADVTFIVKKDYATGVEILQKGYTELNNRNIIDDENRGQLMFNAFVDESVDDPAEAWKWRGTRSMARNKGIAMHAQLTASYLLPMFMAQNDEDEVDQDFSEVMRDIIEWMAAPTNSNYQSSFLQIVFGMMTNPVTYMGAEWFEIMQTIKERQADGKLTKKEVLDEVLSGFKAPIWSAAQILINNAFERNIQKQKAIIKRRYISYDEAQAKYGQHENWKYVKCGIISIYDEVTGLFYDVKDESANEYLVAEEVWECRRDDSEIPFVNGIYFGEPDVDNNPIKHRDNFGAPKYNVVPFGYSRIGEHFFYYKSMMNCLGWDNSYYDAMTEVVMNRSFLEVEPPLVITGTDDEVDSDVIFPNAVISMEGENSKAGALLPPSNITAGFIALRETEKSLNEGSVNEVGSGQLPNSTQTAFAIAQAQAAAKKLLGTVAKSLAESIAQVGDLMKDIAINHLAAAQVDELVGGKLKLKYRTFLMQDSKGGLTKNKKVKFDPSLIGAEMTDDEKETEEYKMLEDMGWPDNKDTLRIVNPELFAKYRYLTIVDVEEMFPKNSEYWQPVLLNLKEALLQDPTVNQEFLTKKLAYAYFQSEGDDMVQTPPPPQQQIPPPQDPNNPGGGNQFGQQVKNRQLAGAAVGAGV